MHAAGLPRDCPECDRCSQDRILEQIAGMTALCGQYDGTHYSNLGISLLGRALEQVAGKTWEEFMLTDLMRPLGMVNSGPPPATNVRMADGVDPDTGKLVPPPKNSTWDAPCGLLHSTLKDMRAGDTRGCAGSVFSKQAGIVRSPRPAHRQPSRPG